MGMMKNIFKKMNEMMNMKKMEKMNMNKNEKKMEKMNKGIENLTSLKNLKNLMQIFSNFVNLVKLVMQIFHKFATFATFAMQIFKRSSVATLRTVPVKSTVKVALKSRISPILPLLATVVMLMGFGTQEAWGLDEYVLVLEKADQIAQYNGDNLNKLISIEGESNKRFHAQNDHAIFEVDKIESYNGTLKQLEYPDLSKNNNRTSYFTWNTDTVSIYEIIVSQVLVKLRAYRAGLSSGGSTDSYFTDGVTTGETVHCNTNWTGSSDVSIYASTLLTPLSLYMTADNGGGRRYYIHEINYTYSIYHKEYLFYFSATTGSNNGAYGTATATVTNSSKQAAKWATSESTTATFTASPESGYGFLGWSTSVDGSTGYVSTENPYSTTINNSTAGVEQNLTLYAIFSEAKVAPTIYDYFDDFYEVDKEGTIDLSELWTTNSDGAVTYSKVSFAPSGSNNDEATAPDIAIDGHTLSLGQAGTVTLRMAITEGTNHLACNETIEVVIKKHTPEFTWYSDENAVHYNETIENFCTSNNAVTSITRNSSVENVATISDATLTTYNKAGTTRITMSQEENYYWKEYSEYRDITPVRRPNAIPMPALSTWTEDTKGVYIIESVDDDGSVWLDGSESHGGVKCLDICYGSKKVSDKYMILAFTGIPDSLFFKHKVKSSENGSWYIYQGATSSSINDEVWSSSSKSTSWSDLQRVKLSPTTRYLKFVHNGKTDAWFTDLQITRLEQFETTPTSLDFETVLKDSEPAARKFTFTHCNAGYRVTATSSDATHYKVSLNAAGPWSESVVIPSTGGDRMGTQDIYVKYYPADAATHNATITLSDQLGNSKTVNVTGVTQSILATSLEWIGETATYNVDADSIAVSDLFRVTYNAGRNVVASPTITLATSDDTKIRIVTVDGVDYIDFLCGGSTVTITASYAGDGETYEEASDLEQEITVNKLVDAIVWDAEADGEGKFHVWADSDIPDTIASANTAIVTYASGSSDYLTATQTAGVWTLHAVKQGEVTLTATSVGDCTYATATDTKTIVIDYCYHSINWEQSFVGITTDDNEGNVDKLIDLTAYAVDSTGKATGVAITYSVADPTIATIVDGNKLHIIKQGETTIKAKTASSTKYAIDSLEYDIRVNIPGKNTVSCKNNKDRNDIRDNKIVIYGPHATFTFSGATKITEYYGSNGYALANDFGAGEKAYSFTWATTNPNCSIQVKRISFWAKAYNWYAGNASEGKVIFNGEQTKKVGTASLTSTKSDYAQFDLSEDFSSGVTVVCKSEGANFDFYIRNISIEYEVFATTAPTATEDTTDVYATASIDDKHLVELDGLFSMENRPSDFGYEYELKEAYDDAHIYSDNKFYADAAGEYEVRARVADSADHHGSDWSTGYVRIRVNRMPNTLSVAGLVDNSGEMELGSTLPGVIITATNAGSPIVCEQTSGAGLISYDQATGVVTSGNKLGTGVWRISQEQTEQYLAAESSFTVAITNDTIVPSVGDEGKPISDWDTKPTAKDNLSLSSDLTIDEPISVYSLSVAEDAQVTITPTGGLTVGAGGIEGAVQNKFVLQVDEDGGTKGQTAFLRISPEYTGAMPEVTMEMLRIGYSASYTQDNFNARGVMAWQYMGAPIDAEETLLKSIVGGWINSWDEETGTWVNNKSTARVTPFVGFANSQSKSASGAKTQYKGTIVENRTHNVPLSYHEESEMAGWNLLANSFTAPIEIAKMLDDIDEEEMETTIYLFNTGSTSAVDGDAGTYVSVPIANAGKTIAGVTYPGVIPAMQGFFVKAKKEEVSLKLDYSKIVWGATSPNTPMRVKAKDEEESPIYGVYITLMADGARDNLHIIESEDFTPARDKGYDAAYMPVGGLNIFAVENEEDYLAVDATNSIIGTKIGVRTGEEFEYTMKFSHVIVDHSIALFDKEMGEVTPIYEGTEYIFYAEPNEVISERFEIVERFGAPNVTTGNEGAGAEVNAQKFIKDNSLYIYKDGVLFNALGERVR